MTPMDDDGTSPPVKECRACDIGWGVIGLVVSLGLGLMAVDLLLGGRLTRFITGPSLAPVLSLAEDEDDDAA